MNADAKGDVSLSRMAKAVHLIAEPLADGRWRVVGGRHPHVVDLNTGECDCADHTIRGGRCKHLLCAQLRAGGDPEAFRALAALVPEPRRVRRAS